MSRFTAFHVHWLLELVLVPSQCVFGRPICRGHKCLQGSTVRRQRCSNAPQVTLATLPFKLPSSRLWFPLLNDFNPTSFWCDPSVVPDTWQLAGQ